MARSEFPLLGVSRRDFLKYCGWIAATLAIPSISGADVADALETAMTKRPSVVWSTFQACTGCAISLLQSREPTVANLIFKQISLDYQDNIMAAAGTAADELFAQVTEGDFYWVVEGSVPTTIPEAVTIAGKPAIEVLRETYPKAKGVIAHGTCATYGNIQAARPNPTGAMGIGEYLRGEGGIPDATVINMPRCPGNGEDLVLALSYVLVTGKLPELDSIGRPTILYGSTIHDNCFRRGHFDAGEFAETYGDAHWNDGWCLYKMGCKGPVTYAPCGVTKWNGNVSWCVHNGPCMGCSEPDFWDKLTPFTEQAPGVSTGIGPVSAEQIGIAMGVATAVGLGVHAVGQAVTGRMGKGGPPEGEGEVRDDG